MKTAFYTSYETITKIFKNTQGLEEIEEEEDPNKRINPK